MDVPVEYEAIQRATLLDLQVLERLAEPTFGAIKIGTYESEFCACRQ